MRIRICLLLCLLLAAAPLASRIKSGVPDTARLQLMLQKLTVVGNALYIGAHPDDENTAMLSYLSFGKLVGAAYLSLNRGEGGQNLIGPEQGDLLGVIRTQELLAAREVDQANQFFTRAVDFGFSKSPEESLQFWGKEDVLSDVVWVIRKFRPDVIITRFPKEGGGHGHHTASALLAEEAFDAAADPSKFPEQLKYVAVWKPTRIVWNRYTWGENKEPAAGENFVTAPLGDYNRLLGKSYTELAGIGRSMHKSQGFGDSEDRGKYVNYFRHTAGAPAAKDLFDAIDLSWNRIRGAHDVGKVLTEASRSFNPDDPSATIPSLLKAYSLMQSLLPNPWVEEKIAETREAIRACAGMWLEAITEDYSAPAGSTVKIAATVLNRSNFPFRLESIEMLPTNTIEEIHTVLRNNEPFTKELRLAIPADQAYSQPYWLMEKSSRPFAAVTDQRLRGLPETPAALQVRFHLMSGPHRISFDEPLFFREVDPVRGEVYREFEIVPEVAVQLQQPVTIFADTSAKNISLNLLCETAGISGEINLTLPPGWQAEPESRKFQFEKKGGKSTVEFSVKPSGSDAQSGPYIAQALIGSKKISRGVRTIDYPHIPVQTVFPPAEGKLVRIDLKKSGENIGYIMGSGDEIPEALKQVGFRVTLLNPEDLGHANLSTFDAIIAGIRAYNTHPQLKAAHSTLLDYVRAGGTFIVQYNTLQDLDQRDLGPYPFRISRDRVSVETAPVTILKSGHGLMNFPNKITPEDFSGWVQERGLYFPDQWDAKYETIFASNDPGESPKEGGILFARYGKGAYIYTAYSWFRQLPAGVPGGYRIFVNLIAAGRSHETQ